MSDPAVDIVVRVASSLLSDIFKSVYSDLKGWIGNKADAHDVLSKGASRYGKKMIQRYNVVRIFGMNKPVPLKDLYVRANILKDLSVNSRINLRELEAAFSLSHRALRIDRKLVPANEVVNNLEKFIVLGQPGAGKTTFLKYLVLQSLDKSIELKNRRIPIFITLRDFADSGLSLFDFIQSQFDTCQFEDAGPFIRRILEKGKCQLLLDGFDEVEENDKDRVIKDIIDLSDKYSENQFIISCRIAAYGHWFVHFTDIEIADFQNDQKKTFIFNWFKKEPNIAVECWENIQSNLQLNELAKTPLLLTLLCIAFDESYGFPSNRADLYRDAIEALLKKWDSSRRIRRGEIYKGLSLRTKNTLLSRVAAEFFQEEEYFFEKRKLAKKISDFIKNVPGFNDDSLEVDSGDVLKAIESQHGIFIQRAKGIYSFSHLAIQEYFTAKYIVDNALNGTVENLVTDYLFTPRWGEVILLTSGMLGESKLFFEYIRKSIEKFALENQILSLYLKHAFSVFPEDSLSTSKRIFALFICTLIYRDRLLNLASNEPEYRLSSINCAFILTYSLLHLIDLSQNRLIIEQLEEEDNLRQLEVIKIFSNDLHIFIGKDADLVSLQSDLFQGQFFISKMLLNFEKEINHSALDEISNTTLSPEEFCDTKRWEEVRKYTYVNALMIKCLTSESYISGNLRSELSKEILLQPK